MDLDYSKNTKKVWQPPPPLGGYYLDYCYHNQYWVSSPLHTQTITNVNTYLYVYLLKHRWLLTLNRTIHALFIVNLSSYICIVLWRVCIQIFKAVASFCWKGADWSQVRYITMTFWGFHEKGTHSLMCALGIDR